MPPISRQIRQMIQTDRYFGLDHVPLPPLGRKLVAEHGQDLPPVAKPVQAAAEAASVAESRGKSADKAAALAAMQAQMTEWVAANWPRDGWSRLVFGEGDADAALMFIGEGPGAEEDAQGRPFVGRAGQLLDKQIAAMKLQRQQVYIANIAKTRPPDNRVPTPEEATLWLPWLEKQIDIIRPKVIVALGATSAKYLLGDSKLAITRVRGQWKTYRGIDLMPTFHPAYLVRQYTTENRQRVWSDLQAVMKKLGIG
jgi:DNA polymerase